MTIVERYLKKNPNAVNMKKISGIPKRIYCFGNGYMLCDVYQVTFKDGSTKEEHIEYCYERSTC